MTRADIIAAVKVKLEELTPFSEGLVVLSSSTDVKPIQSYIDKTLNEASDEVRMLLPLHMLPADVISGTVTVTNGVGVLPLASDYLRLYAIKAPEWAREVNRPISVENPEYLLQSNPHTRGKSQKPVVAINRTTTGRILELYTVATAELTKQLYVKQVVAETNPDPLVPYIVLMCAIKVCDIFGEKENSDALTKDLTQMIKLQAL